MMKRLTVFCAAWLLPAVGWSATVSVSPGDSLDTLTAELVPGTTIIFTDGVYPLEDTLRWGGLGTATEPITLKAQNAGKAVLRLNAGGYVAEVQDATHLFIQGLVFEGGDTWMDEGFNGLRILASADMTTSDITVEDCEIRNISRTGLRVDGNVNHITIRRNHIHDTFDGTGISVGCNDASCWMQDSVIAENLVHNLGGEWIYGIYLANGSQGNTISDNVIYQSNYRGMYVGSTEFGEANEITGNIIWQVFDTGLYLEGAAVVQNNVIFDVEGYGIRSRNDDERQGLYQQVISHNTVVNTTDDAARLEDWFFQEGMVFTNNVLANPTGYGLDYDDEYTEYDTTTNYIRNNYVTGLVEGYDRALFPDWVQPGGGYGDFLDVENWDFYPTGSSMLVNAGDTSAEAWVPQTDFNGAPREGDQPDVGAYEWDGDANPGWVVQEGFKELGYSNSAQTHDVGSGGCCGGKEEEPTQEGLFFLPLLGLGWMFRRRR